MIIVGKIDLSNLVLVGIEAHENSPCSSFQNSELAIGIADGDVFGVFGDFDGAGFQTLAVYFDDLIRGGIVYSDSLFGLVGSDKEGIIGCPVDFLNGEFL